MPLNRMDQVLAAAQRRLRTRRAIRGAAVGAWVGVAAGATAVAIRHLGLVADPIPVTVAVMGLVIAVGIGGVVGAARPGLGSRQTALLLDQALQTEELLVTARWIQDQDPTPSRHAVLAALEQVDPALVPQVLPLRAPPHLRWVGVALLAVVIGLLEGDRGWEVLHDLNRHGVLARAAAGVIPLRRPVVETRRRDARAHEEELPEAV